jgi:hypothetical protein
MLRRVALVRTDVSEEPGASFIKVTRIDELETTPAATKYAIWFYPCSNPVRRGGKPATNHLRYITALCP